MSENRANRAYEEAGVNLEAGYESVRRIRRHIKNTWRPEVLSDIGGFGGMFAPQVKDMEEPVLISGTDGVGTKLKLAFLLDKHDTIGQDCVAMCVNDIICAGAEPLFFLDYIACGKNDPAKIEAIVKGVSDGLAQAGCALIGGETAEMPGFYQEEEYDLAGFVVGMVDKKKIPQGDTLKAGDKLIGLPSSGVHSNGFSLVRKIFDLDNEDKAKVLESLAREVPGTSQDLGHALLEPTKIYVKPVLDLFSKIEVKGVSHITGGGFYENIPRAIPEESGLKALIHKDLLKILPLFSYIEEVGGISEEDMFNTFNMGVGMVLIVNEENVDLALESLKDQGAYVIGELVEDKTSKDPILWA